MCLKSQVIKGKKGNWLGIWHVYLKGEFYRGIWCGNLLESDYLGDLEVDGRIILNFILKK